MGMDEYVINPAFTFGGYQYINVKRGISMLIVQILINTADHHMGLMMCDEKGYDDKIGEDSVCEW